MNISCVCSTEIPYEITVWTGELRSAGTDANVFIQMYGENGKTEEYALRNKTDNFETSQVDKFKVMTMGIYSCTLKHNMMDCLLHLRISEMF